MQGVAHGAVPQGASARGVSASCRPSRLLVSACPRKLRHPDVAGVLAQIEDNLVPRDCKTRRAKVQVPPRQASCVKVLNAQSGSSGPLRGPIKRLSPQARRAVAIRPEIQQISLWRPGRRIAIGADHDPVFLSCDNAPLYFRDDDSRRRQPIRSGVEYDPAAIRGEARAVDPVPRMLQPAVVVRRADLQDPHA